MKIYALYFCLHQALIIFFYVQTLVNLLSKLLNYEVFTRYFLKRTFHHLERYHNNIYICNMPIWIMNCVAIVIKSLLGDQSAKLEYKAGGIL